MQKECMDGFFRKFETFGEMIDYHKELSANSVWVRKKVNELYVAALDMTSALIGSVGLFAPGISDDAVMDTVSNMGLAMYRKVIIILLHLLIRWDLSSVHIFGMRSIKVWMIISGSAG